MLYIFGSNHVNIAPYYLCYKTKEYSPWKCPRFIGEQMGRVKTAIVYCTLQVMWTQFWELCTLAHILNVIKTTYMEILLEYHIFRCVVADPSCKLKHFPGVYVMWTDNIIRKSLYNRIFYLDELKSYYTKQINYENHNASLCRNKSTVPKQIKQHG